MPAHRQQKKALQSAQTLQGQPYSPNQSQIASPGNSGLQTDVAPAPRAGPGSGNNITQA
ncbi:hypothetical protein Tamer19_37320 [Cupriavidus sp. TA19]|nr:hypothetical protein Tamer19_37320 [Cupriavidus sp. TA19]